MLVFHAAVEWVWTGGREVCAIDGADQVGCSAVWNAEIDWLIRQNNLIVVNFVRLRLV